MTELDYLQLFFHFAMLSLLAVGGALSVVPDMHRYLVNDHHWLGEELFSQSVTLAQIAPGPNILLVAVMGWNLGWQPHTDSVPTDAMAVVKAGVMAFALLICSVLPSSLLTYQVGQWLQVRQQALGVRAFKTGMVPLVMGLMLSAGVLLEMTSNPTSDWRLVLVCGISALLVLHTRIHVLWLMLAGAVVGVLFGL